MRTLLRQQEVILWIQRTCFIEILLRSPTFNTNLSEQYFLTIEKYGKRLSEIQKNKYIHNENNFKNISIYSFIKRKIINFKKSITIWNNKPFIWFLFISFIAFLNHSITFNHSWSLTWLVSRPNAVCSSFYPDLKYINFNMISLEASWNLHTQTQMERF